MLEMLKSKIHRATVTDANLNYTGSITISEDLMDEAGILPYEKVHILNINNGARFETYTIRGKRNSCVICLNGAAARQVQPGDKIIILTYTFLEKEKAEEHKPTIVFVDGENKIIKGTSEGSLLADM